MLFDRQLGVSPVLLCETSHRRLVSHGDVLSSLDTRAFPFSSPPVILISCVLSFTSFSKPLSTFEAQVCQKL